MATSIFAATAMALPHLALGGLRATDEAAMVVTDVVPPILAPRFNMDFSEVEHSFGWGAGTSNKGSFHYDYPGERQVWLHGKGHSNNWCQCAGVQTDEACHLISAKTSDDPEGAMYVAFKSLNKCCKLGPWAQGFGPLRPDWLRLTNATVAGTKQVGNKVCTTWASAHPGDWFMMVSDDWSVDSTGRLCAYEDHFKFWARWLGMHHELTFDSSSYSEDAEADEVFSVPKGIGCEETCPNTAGEWCKAR